MLFWGALDLGALDGIDRQDFLSAFQEHLDSSYMRAQGGHVVGRDLVRMLPQFYVDVSDAVRWRRTGTGNYPPEAPVISANRPVMLLSTFEVLILILVVDVSSTIYVGMRSESS